MSLKVQVLEALGAPRFVYRYSRTRNTVPRLQRKLEYKLLAEKYNNYLSNHNTFAIFQWLPSTDLKFDKNYYWKEFANDVSSFKRDTVFLQDKLHNGAMNNCIKSAILPSNDDKELRCVFQTLSKPDPIESMLRLTMGPDSKLQLCVLGLRTEGNNVASYIQHLLEESEDLYKNISYEKLISIARRLRTDKDKPTKKLLNSLAENGLTTTRLVGQDKWLILLKP